MRLKWSPEEGAWIRVRRIFSNWLWVCELPCREWWRSPDHLTPGDAADAGRRHLREVHGVRS